MIETSNGAPSQPPVYAAIDLGTNNCRLLIAQPGDESRNRIHVIDSFSRIVRLGENIGKTGKLSDAAVKRATEALKVCAYKIKSRGALQTRAIATEACRKAINVQEFFNHVKQETGILFKTITPIEEAKLTLAGCRPLLTTKHPKVLMFDIGGGSTELIWLENKPTLDQKIIDIKSLPIGVVSLAEEFSSDKLSAKKFEIIVGRIDNELAPFDKTHGIKKQINTGNVHVLGTSGTMTTMGAIYLNQTRYNRSKVDGLSIRYESINAICKNLISLDIEARQNHPCIGPGRADLMVMGCTILTAICRRWPTTHLTAADRGIREGLLMEMINTNRAIS